MEFIERCFENGHAIETLACRQLECIFMRLITNALGRQYFVTLKILIILIISQRRKCISSEFKHHYK